LSFLTRPGFSKRPLLIRSQGLLRPDLSPPATTDNPPLLMSTLDTDRCVDDTDLTSCGFAQTAVLILGMHRSGTSLLSSLVQALGIDLGDDLIAGDHHNPAGYFEDRQCVDIQERMLETLGQPWWEHNGMLPFPAQWRQADALRPLIAELEAWIDKRQSTAATIWAVKDPRTTRFLPLWRELLLQRGIRPRYLLAVRDPAEVAASEVKRNNVPARRVYHNWLRHNMEALLHGGADLAGVFVYDAWFADGDAHLRRLAASLGVALTDAKAEDILGRLVHRELRHAPVGGEPPPLWASDVYGKLQSLAAAPGATGRCRLATEAEYCDALLRLGEEPAADGPLAAVLASGQGHAAALNLAQKLRRSGARVVLNVRLGREAGHTPAAVTPGVAVVSGDSPGPIVSGGHHTCAAYEVWQWLARRAFAEIHIEGGEGLAVHCLDARRQGWPDRHGPIHVHYFARPRWLGEDGRLHFRSFADAEAWGLEGRVVSNAGSCLHAPPALAAMLRHVAAGGRSYGGSPPASGNDPLVTICITHHNRPALLSDCLDSVRAQSYRNLEVGLVDDGSTQPAARMFLCSLEQEFAAKGWILIRQQNGYLGAARNAAAGAAKGDYLFILDDDNLLLRDGIERAVRIARRADADIVTGAMAMFRGPAGTRPQWPERLRVFPGGVPLLGLFENTLGDANALVRRDCWSAVGGFTEDRGVGAEDWEFFAKATLRGYRLEHSLTPLSWYRISATGMALGGDWWSDYRRALRAYEAVLPPALHELPALAGAMWREDIATEAQLRQLEAELAAREHSLAGANDHARQLEAELASREHSLAEAHDQARHLEAELAARERCLEEAISGLTAAAAREHTLIEQVRLVEAALGERALEAGRLQAESNELHAQLAAVLGSSSWRVTWPLRRALSGRPRSARTMRRVAQLGWWTLTLQLPRRIAAARRRDRMPPTALPPRAGPGSRPD
jgi:glycosyltransferase involved in cell wall biosynthesis